MKSAWVLEIDNRCKTQHLERLALHCPGPMTSLSVEAPWSGPFIFAWDCSFVDRWDKMEALPESDKHWHIAGNDDPTAAHPWNLAGQLVSHVIYFWTQTLKKKHEKLVWRCLKCLFCSGLHALDFDLPVVLYHLASWQLHEAKRSARVDVPFPELPSDADTVRWVDRAKGESSQDGSPTHTHTPS